MANRYKSVILDRDGVINSLRNDYVKSTDEFLFISRSLLALKALHEKNIDVFVATNQSAVGRGIINKDQLENIHRDMQNKIFYAGGCVKEIFICEHAPGDLCKCRKPQSGLLRKIFLKYEIKAESTIFVGDSLSDYLAACDIGIEFAAVLTGNLLSLEASKLPYVKVYSDLYEFAHVICN